MCSEVVITPVFDTGILGSNPNTSANLGYKQQSKLSNAQKPKL